MEQTSGHQTDNLTKHRAELMSRVKGVMGQASVWGEVWWVRTEEGPDES
jgi:hypothetical protein